MIIVPLKSFLLVGSRLARLSCGEMIHSTPLSEAL